MVERTLAWEQNLIVFQGELRNTKVKGNLGKFFGLDEVPENIENWLIQTLKKVNKQDVQDFLELLAPNWATQVGGTKLVAKALFSADLMGDDRKLLFRVFPALVGVDPETACNLLYKINSFGKYKVEIEEKTLEALAKTYRINISEQVANIGKLRRQSGPAGGSKQ